MAKWYTLGAKASIFWDPTQPEPDNRQLLSGEVKQLEESQHVSQWRKSGGIVEVTEAEAKDLLKKSGDTKKINQAAANDKAKEILNTAAAKEQLANETMQQAETKLAEAKGHIDENDRLKAENEELKAKLDKASQTK